MLVLRFGHVGIITLQPAVILYLKKFTSVSLIASMLFWTEIRRSFTVCEFTRECVILYMCAKIWYVKNTLYISGGKFRDG
jgi:hypothetical protein